MDETVYIIQRHANIIIRVHIIRVCIEQHRSVCVRASERHSHSCDSQCPTTSHENAIWWRLVIGPIKSFNILSIGGATSRHLLSFDALYKFIYIFIASILVLSGYRMHLQLKERSRKVLHYLFQIWSAPDYISHWFWRHANLCCFTSDTVGIAATNTIM